MKPHYLSSIVLVPLAAMSISAEAKGPFMGLEMPPMPAGCSHRESMAPGTSGSFAYERLACNGKEVVLLQRFKDHRGKLAYWEVIDELELPARTSNSQALDVPLCSSSSYPKDSILAIGRWTTAKDGSFIAKNISRAWRFNLVEGKIEAISQRGVSCEGDNPE